MDTSTQVGSFIRSNVVGLMALFVALSGTAFAAQVATEKAAKGGAKTAKAKKGPRGPAGPAGPAGPQGPVGPLTGPAGGALAGDYPNPSIAPNAVSGPAIADGTQTRSDIGVASGTVAFDPPSLAAGSCSSVSAALSGVLPGDVIIANNASASGGNGLSVQAFDVFSADLVTLYFCNVLTDTNDAPSMNWQILAIG